MEILNVDAFAAVTRQISLGGKKYPIEELDVQQFINNLKAAEELEKADAKTPTVADAIEEAVKIISQGIPTLPVEQIRKLKLPAMTAVLQFVRGEPVTPAEGVSQATAATTTAEGDEAKKPT